MWGGSWAFESKTILTHSLPVAASGPSGTLRMNILDYYAVVPMFPHFSRTDERRPHVPPAVSVAISCPNGRSEEASEAEDGLHSHRATHRTKYVLQEIRPWVILAGSSSSRQVGKLPGADVHTVYGRHYRKNGKGSTPRPESPRARASWTDSVICPVIGCLEFFWKDVLRLLVTC